MQPTEIVEAADRMSRKRAIVVAVAAAAFLAIQVVLRPFFAGGADPANHTQINLWAINAIVLLLGLATGGGLLNRRALRTLVNDEVARANRQTAVAAGYWVAMAMAMGLYLLHLARDLTGREAVYIIVTSSLVVALFAFAWLEYRAHRDA